VYRPRPVTNRASSRRPLNWFSGKCDSQCVPRRRICAGPSRPDGSQGRF
jgi:hypothetical protein